MGTISPPHHISMLSLNNEGWIIAADPGHGSNDGVGSRGNDGNCSNDEITSSGKDQVPIDAKANEGGDSISNKADGSNVRINEEDDGDTSNHDSTENCSVGNIEISSNCRVLMKELQLTFSDVDMAELDHCFIRQSSSASTVLEDLPYIENLSNLFIKVIADVNRMRGPEFPVSNNDNGDEENGENSKNGNASNNGRGGNGRRDRRRGGRVAQLEEQRRLRKQQSQHQESEQQMQDEVNKGEKQPLHSNQGQNNLPQNGKDGGNDFVVVGKNNIEIIENDADFTEEPPNILLAQTFNTLRILIALLRPLFHHPQILNTQLKMKHGPSLKSNGKKNRYFLFTKHFYSTATVGSWNDLLGTYKHLLKGIDLNLPNMLEKKDERGMYEFQIKDWITPLFLEELYLNPMVLMKQCIDLPIYSGPNNLAPASPRAPAPSSPSVASQLNEMMINQFSYDCKDKQALLQKSIATLRNKLTDALTRRFGHQVRLSVYGSCMSNLALEGSHDVDISVYIPRLSQLKERFDKGLDSAEHYEKQMRKIIFQVRDALRNYSERICGSFVDLFAITKARVPVVKGTDVNANNPYSADGSLSFDLCFLNDIAVVNSSMLREYSLFDYRVRILMLTIKSFAKRNGIGSAADGTLSSYSWLNLVVFYLQCIGFLPVLQCPELMAQHGFAPNKRNNHWHCINDLETYYLTHDQVHGSSLWKQPEHFHDNQPSPIQLPHLLYGFFHFYSDVFPRSAIAASIRLGKCTLQKTNFKTCRLWRLCVEDPFETCDSHCPHDLGCHLDEAGQKKIHRYLARAKDELGLLLRNECIRDDGIENFMDLINSKIDGNGAIEGKNQKSKKSPDTRQNQPEKRANGNEPAQQNDGKKGQPQQQRFKPPHSSKHPSIGPEDSRGGRKGGNKGGNMHVSGGHPPHQSTRTNHPNRPNHPNETNLPNKSNHPPSSLTLAALNQAKLTKGKNFGNTNNNVHPDRDYNRPKSNQTSPTPNSVQQQKRHTAPGNKDTNSHWSKGNGARASQHSQVNSTKTNNGSVKPQQSGMDDNARANGGPRPRRRSNKKNKGRASSVDGGKEGGAIQAFQNS